MARVDQGNTLDECLRKVPGNAAVDVKRVVRSLLDVFVNDGYGMRTTRHLDLVEVSIVPNVDEPSREQARVVLELIVTEDMLNPVGKMHGACIAHLVDLCTTLPIVAMSHARGGTASAGVSQNINIIYHAPASPGDKLRLVNTSTTIGARTRSARVEIWDATHHRLVASATQVKMEASTKL